MSITSWLESLKARLLGTRKSSKTRNRQGEAAKQTTKGTETLEIRTLLTVNPVNDFYNISEDAILTDNAPGVLANDPAPVGTANVNQLTNPLHGTALIIADGKITFDPTASAALQSLNAGQNSIQSFTYNVLDDGDFTVGTTATVFVTVQGANDQVSATGLGQTVAYDEDDASAASTAIILSDADAGDNYTVNLGLGNLSAGTFSLASTTGLSFGTGDGTNDTTMSFSGTLTNVNAALASITFNPAANFDVDTVINVTIQDGGENGTVAVNGTITLDVTPMPDNFTVDSPTFNLDENSANTTVVGSVTPTSPDTGESFTYTITAGNTGTAFAINSSTGQITVADVNDVNFEVNPSFTLTVEVEDDDGNIQNSTVTINLNDLNEAPVFTPNGPFNLDENSVNTTVVGNAGGIVDPDAGDTHTYSITGGNTGGAFAIDATTGQITVANSGAVNFEVNPTFTLTIEVEDFDGLTHSGNVTINLNDLNEDPVFTSASTANTFENSTAAIDANATDEDLDVLTYSLSGGADVALFGIDANTGVVTFNVAPNFEAPADANTDNVYEIQVEVDDGNGGVVTQNISITVQNVNESPVITSGNTATVNENQTGAIDVDATDQDAGAVLTYSISGGADQGLFSIDPNSGVLTFDSAPNFEAPADANTDNDYIVQVTVSDGTNSVNQTITITVADLNEDPVFTSANTANAAENQTAVLTVTTTDDDGDVPTYSLSGGADQALFSIDPNTGVLTFSAPPNFEAPADANTDNVYLVQVQADDGSGGVVTQNISVTVTNVNESPSITSGNTATVNENQTGAIDVNATDPDAGAVLTYSISGGADSALFSIDPNTGVLTFSSAPSFENPLDANTDNDYVVQVTVSDGSLSVNQTITITVADVAEDPVISSANSASVAENQTGAIDVDATDDDGGVPTYAIIGGADQALFSIDMNTGVVTFQVAPDFETPTDANTDNVYEIQVEVDDGNGGVVTQNISITVTGLNDNNPVITTGNTPSINENQTTAIDVNATDADLPGDTLTFSITGGADAGLFSIDPNTGLLTFDSAPDFEDPQDANTDNDYVVQVTVSDGTNSVNQTITVTVNNVNEDPVFTSASAVNAAENQTAVVTVTTTDGDGDVPTYAISGGADQALFSIDPNTGVLTFQAAPDFEVPADANTDNVYEVQVEADDGNGGVVTQNISVTVTNVNESPSITSGNTATVNENQTGAIDVNATDPDAGAVLTYSISGGADQALFSIDPNTGVLTFQAAPNFEDPQDANTDNDYVVQVTVSDGSLSVNQTITITVADLNEDPVFTSANTANAAENQTAVLTVTTTDDDGDVPTYSLSGGADQALFSIDPNTGVLTFNAPPNFEAPADANTDNVYLVQVQADDGNGGVVTQNISVTVTNVNESPSITSGNTATVNENQTGAIDVDATDPDAGAVLTYSITGGADQALFNIDPNTGVLTFQAAPDFDNPSDANTDNDYAVQVTVSDGSLSVNQTITITVADLNEDPVFTSASAVNAAENQTAVLTVTTTDDDGDVPTYSISGGADQALFSIDPNTGVLTFQAAPNFEAPADANTDNVYLVQVQADDGNGGVVTQNISVTVTDVNETPVITSGNTATVNENQTAAIDVNATDPDTGAVLTYSITGGADAGLFSIDPNTGVLTFDSAPNFEDPDDANTDNDYVVQVTVSDGSLSVNQTITITVADVNEDPVFTSASAVNAAENQTAVVTVTTTDDDGDVPTYSLSGGADQALFSIDPNTGVLTFQSAPNFEAPADANTDNVYEVQVEADDGSGGVVTQNISVTVTNVNESPVITSGNTATVNENQTGAIDVNATDPDTGAVLTYSITGGADAGLFSIDPNSGVLTFDSAPNFEAPADANTDNDYVVQVTVSDGSLSVNQTITITVADVNEDPVFTSASAVNAAENQTAVVTVTTTDDDGDVPTYSLSGGADQALFSIDPNTGVLTFLSAPNFEAPADANTDNVYLVQVQADDGNGGVVTQNISVTVTNVNESPSITSGNTATVNENQTGAIDVNATDPDAGAVLTYSITGGADQALFSIDPNSGVLTFDSAPNFEAPADANTDNDYVVQVTVSDGTLSVNQTITITVADVNENPVFTSANTANAAENQTAVLTVTTTDDDGDVPTYSLSGGADQALFSIDPNTGVLTFIAPPNFEAPADANTDNVYLVQVQADDGSGGVVTQNISVTVTDVNESPVITSGNTATVNENQTGAIDVNATDPDAGAVLTYSITGGVDQALFNIDPNTGVLTFQSAPNFEAPADANTDNDYVVQVTVSDGSLSVNQTITITVANVNEAPIAQDDNAVVDEDGSVNIDILANDSDPDGDLLLILVSAPQHGTTQVNDNGSPGDLSDDYVVYTPAAQYYGPDSFTYIVSDGNGGFDGATVNVTVNEINDNPAFIASGPFSIAEDSGNGTSVGTVVAIDSIDAPNTNNITYSITGGDPDGIFTIDSNTGEITVVDSSFLDYESNDSYVLEITATDDGNPNLPATANVTVNITNVNESPDLSDATFSVDENSSNGTVVGTVASGDPDSPETLSFAITAGDPNGIFAIDSNGQITVADGSLLNYESTTQYVLTVEVEDLGGLTDTATITINVNDVNEAPTIGNATFNIDENSTNGTSVGTFTGSDVDAGAVLTYSITGGNTGGAFAIDANTGEITVANSAVLDFETTPSFSLTVEVSDGSLTDSGTVTVNLNDVNEAPTLGDATIGLAENSANGTLVGTIIGSDVDAGANGVLTYSITGGNTNNAFTIDSMTGEITVNDSTQLDFETTPTFNLTVEVSDGGSLTDTATVTINLSNVNEDPVIGSNGGGPTALLNVDENTTAVTVNFAVDPDAGAVLTYSISGPDSSLFSIDSVTGVLTFSAAPNFENPQDVGADNDYEVTVTVSDGLGGSDSQALTITVVDVNEVPIIVTANSEGVAENQLSALDVDATDPDAGDVLTYSISGGADSALFSIDPNTGALTFIGMPNFEAPSDANTNNVYEVDVSVSDGALITTQSLQITVTNVNEAPVLNDSTISVPENTGNGLPIGLVAATDPDAGTLLTYSITGGNTSGAFAINPTTGLLTVANSAALNFEVNPTFSLTVQVSDGTLNDTATVTINLTNVNETPDLTTGGPFSLAENSTNGTVVGTAGTVSDPDAGDTLTYSIIGGNTGGVFAIDGTTGEITVANSTLIDFETTPSYTLTIQVSDAGGLVDSGTVTINLTNVNEAPDVLPATFSIDENSPNATVIGTVTATDPDAGDTKTFSIIGGNTGGALAIDPVTGVITIADSASINYEVNPVFTLTVQVEDEDGLTDTATVTINLNNLDDPLFLSLPNPDPVYVANKGAVIIDALADAVDEDTPNINYRGGSLTVTIINNGSANDRLEIRNQGVGPGLIAVSGSTIQFQGSTVASFTGGTGTTPLTFTFSQNITDDAVIALMRVITFRIKGTPASLATRTVEYHLVGADSGVSATANKDISVALVSAAPVLTLPGGPIAYTLGSQPILLNTAATVADADSPDFDGGKLIVKITAGAINSNRLTVRNQGTGTGQISVVNKTVYYEGRLLGKISGGGHNSLHIDLKENANVESVQALLRNIQFSVNTGSVNTVQRTYTVSLNDGDGSDSNVPSGTINVSA